jgi:hypothetical protein
MAGIQVAEAREKKQPKVLAHIEIHPQLGGGHIIKHVYQGYQHDPAQVQFDEDGKREGKGSNGEHIVTHLMKHAGLPATGVSNMEGAEGEGDETANEE